MLFFQLRLANPLDLTDSERFPTACKRKAHTLFSRSAGTSDAVHIIFDILRNVVVNNAVHIVYVDSTRRNVRRDQHLKISVPETVHNGISLRLAQIAVQSFRRNASVFQILC